MLAPTASVGLPDDSTTVPEISKLIPGLSSSQRSWRAFRAPIVQTASQSGQQIAEALLLPEVSAFPRQNAGGTWSRQITGSQTMERRKAVWGHTPARPFLLGTAAGCPQSGRRTRWDGPAAGLPGSRLVRPWLPKESPEYRIRQLPAVALDHLPEQPPAFTSSAAAPAPTRPRPAAPTWPARGRRRGRNRRRWPSTSGSRGSLPGRRS